MGDWHPIRVAARRTGLTPHVIRAWEKRYGAIEPKRTETRRRLYSAEDLERLSLLRRGTLSGRSIGQIAHLETEELRRLVEEDEAAQRSVAVRSGASTSRSGTKRGASVRDACLDAIERLDATQLQRLLDDAAVSLSRPRLVTDVVVPLMHTIGERWREGTLRIAHEHMATAVVRAFIANLDGAFQTPPSSPELVVSTPRGHVHELGAVLAAATAASEGWNVTYLGPNLPAEEIAGAARQKAARAVALSLVYPADEATLHAELERLARQLPEETSLIAGGRACEAYRETLVAAGAILVSDFDHLRRELEALRAASG